MVYPAEYVITPPIAVLENVEVPADNVAELPAQIDEEPEIVKIGAGLTLTVQITELELGQPSELVPVMV
jgi:hypothetical protein